MKATTITTRTFTLSDIAEVDAQNLLALTANDDDGARLDIIDPDIEHTLARLRQALLDAGVRRNNAEVTHRDAD